MTLTPDLSLRPDALPAVHAHTPSKRRYVMCPPRYFTVEYVINPWMDPTQPVDTEKALAQWTTLAETYQRLGHEVLLVEPQPGLPDMVFAANSGTVIGGRVLGARFRSAERAAEAEHFRTWFAEHGYTDVTVPVAINEAEGDFAWTGRHLLAGSGFRTDPAAHAEVQETLGVPTVSLRLIDPRFYHLDTALFVLSTSDSPRGEQVVYYPAAFSPGSREVLRRLYPDAVIATEADAMCLGVNGVSDGHNVVLPLEATDLARELKERDYNPIMVDISELRRSGGGPKCCTMELHP